MEESFEEFAEWAKKTYLGKVIDESKESPKFKRYIYVYDVRKGDSDMAKAYLIGIEVFAPDGFPPYIKKDRCCPISAKTAPNFAKKKDFESLIKVWYDYSLKGLAEDKKFLSKTAKIKWNKQ